MKLNMKHGQSAGNQARYCLGFPSGLGSTPCGPFYWNGYLECFRNLLPVRIIAPSLSARSGLLRSPARQPRPRRAGTAIMMIAASAPAVECGTTVTTPMSLLQPSQCHRAAGPDIRAEPPPTVQ
jgi:hypothetical protein